MKEIKIAINAIKKAIQLCHRLQHDHHLPSLLKKDMSPVSLADFMVQSILFKELKVHFPDIAILAEENKNDFDSLCLDNISDIGEFLESTFTDSANVFWVIDPIDGTKGFLRGGQYAIALALIENGKVRLGMLGCPNLDEGSIFYAIRDQGSWRLSLDHQKPKLIQVSSLDSFHDIKLCESVEAKHSSHSHVDHILKQLNVKAPPYRVDSQCKYALVACGEATHYVRFPTSQDYEEKVWDHAAGSIIVEEAGGCVTDLFGKPLDFSCGKTLSGNKGILVSNNQYHEEIKKIAVKEMNQG